LKKDIVFFDMDGTLTPPRKKFNWSLEPALRDLTQWCEVGIVTGSDYNYLMEQMGKFLENSPAGYHIHLLPCNGTKWYKPPPYHDQTHKKVYSVSMEHFLGAKPFQELMKVIIKMQSEISGLNRLTLKGNFIDFRGSTINWCPIGRSSNEQDRLRFIEYDKKEAFRLRYIDRIKIHLKKFGLSQKVAIKTGGQTSFDIFPVGWDKTFALRHFPDWSYWFVGDRCEGNGNDKEIYEACGGQAFKTTGPEATRDIIYEIMKELYEKNSD